MKIDLYLYFIFLKSTFYVDSNNIEKQVTLSQSLNVTYTLKKLRDNKEVPSVQIICRLFDTKMNKCELKHVSKYELHEGLCRQLT